MANLVTHHDPYHIHKILGVLALFNFAMRILMLLYVGKSFVSVEDYRDHRCTWNRLLLDCTCVLLHGLLSWSSLLLPLPQKRNFSSPMIWMEFRWHSITFASRHVIATLLSMWGLWPKSFLWNYLSKLALVLGTCYSADYITAKYGCTTKRTTNAMPYPPNINDDLQKGIKKNYAQAQFIAALMVTSEICEFSFWPLVGIQSAPLLMTLVRKGKVSALFYHRAYIICLYLPIYTYLIGAAMIHGYSHVGDQIFALVVSHTIPYTIRVRFGETKAVTWLIGVAMGIATFGISPWRGPLLVFVSAFRQQKAAKLLSDAIAFIIRWYKFRYYYPLFDLETNVVPRTPHDIVIDWMNRQFHLNINTKSFWGPDKMLKYH